MILNGRENISQKKLMCKSRCGSVGNPPGIEDFAFGVDDIGVRSLERSKGIGGLDVRVLEFHESHVRVECPELLDLRLVGCRAGAGRTGKNHDRRRSVGVMDMGKMGRKRC